MQSRVLISGYLFYILSYIYWVNGQPSSRQRRYLLFTPSTQFGAFVTVSVPLHSESLVSMAWFFEANYYNVANVSYFDPLLGDIGTVTRNDRSIKEMKEFITRQKLYELIESMLEKHGFPGRPCLLRSICENARSHFSYNGLLGDLLHLVLTTSASMSEEDLPDYYYEAEYLGLEDECSFYTAECPEDPLDHITIYLNDLF